MRRISPLLLLLGCGPKIERGPVAVEVREQPVAILAMPDERAPNVYLQAVLDAGSAYDPPGQEGLAALTARAMLEAGAGEWTGQEVRDALFEMGTRFDLVVDREYTSIRLACHADFADRCRDLFVDVLTAPRFRDADVQRLRDQAIDAVTTGLLQDEEALGGEVFHAVLFEAHPYGHPTRGRAGVLPLLDDDATRRFWRSHVRRRAVHVGIAGRYDAPWRAALEDGLAAIPAGDAPELLLPAPAEPEGRELFAVDTDTGVTGWHIGHPLAVGRDHPDWMALHVAMTAFGAHRQSFGRLYQTLRAERGLNYGDYAYAEPFVQRGWTVLPEQGVQRRDDHFQIWIRPTSDANGAFAAKLALDELERLVADGLSEQELSDTVSYLERRTRLEAMDPGRKLAYALDAAVTGEPNVLEVVPEAVGTLERLAVNAAIREHLDPENLFLVAVSGEARALADALLEEMPTPIVYPDGPREALAERDTRVASESLGLERDRVFVVQAEGVFR